MLHISVVKYFDRPEALSTKHFQYVGKLLPIGKSIGISHWKF